MEDVDLFYSGTAHMDSTRALHDLNKDHFEIELGISDNDD